VIVIVGVGNGIVSVNVNDGVILGVAVGTSEGSTTRVGKTTSFGVDCWQATTEKSIIVIEINLMIFIISQTIYLSESVSCLS